jgi:S1-C subfamily serine protease
MNVKSLQLAALLVSLAVAVNAADKSEPDPATRGQMEDKLHSANDRLNEAAREISELTAKLYGEPMIRGSHVLLGINVGEDAAGKSGPGVRVISVSPGGPAANAGIKTNDVILSVEGKKLQTNPGKSPRQELLAHLHDVEPGSPIVVELQRDNKIQTVKVVPKEIKLFMDPGMLPGLQNLDGQFADGDFLKQLESFSGRFDLNGFGSAEFVELTPGLGRYFGTDKGLLVVHPPKDGNLKLEEGDVILDIDGRVPTDGSHALRILNSYRAGESLKLHIMRQQKRVELAVEMPADKLRAARRPIHDAMMRNVLLVL